jgi:ABC-type polysaccharide/polyol phosphate export permease
MLGKLRDLWRYRELVRNLVTRDLKARYKNSLLGVAWSWLNPLLTMAVFTFVFNFLAGRSDLEDYHIFILCALLPWNFFNTSINIATSSIVGNSHLIKKVYFPREVLPLSTVLSNLVNFVISLPVFFILALISGVPVTPWVLLMPLVLFVQVTLMAGISLLLSTLNVFFRDVQMILGIMLTLWFFVTPIFYPISQVPQHATLLGVTFNAQSWLCILNPMAAIIVSYRNILYRGEPVHGSLPLTGVMAVVLLIVGYIVFQRFNPRFAEEV